MTSTVIVAPGSSLAIRDARVTPLLITISPSAHNVTCTGGAATESRDLIRKPHGIRAAATR
jgi:hypothetical protein